MKEPERQPVQFEAKLLRGDDWDDQELCPFCARAWDFHREPAPGTSRRNMRRLAKAGKLCR